MKRKIHPSCDDETLWEKTYRFSLRQCAGRHADAEDLTQDVFSRLLASGALSRYRASAENEGHLIALLRVTATRMVSNARRRDQAEKHRGWTRRVSLDDGEIRIEPAAQRAMNEDRAYRALEGLVAEAEAVLEQEYVQRGDAALFAALRQTLVPDPVAGVPSYAAMAASARKTEGAFRVAVLRVRKRFRHLIQQRLSEVDSADAEPGLTPFVASCSNSDPKMIAYQPAAENAALAS